MMNGKGLTGDDVKWAYRILLNRECESDEMVDEKLARLQDIQGLRADLLTSKEYLQNLDGYREFLLPKECLIIKQSNGFRIHLDLSDRVCMEIANDNYDSLETQFVKRTVKAGDTVLDLGAHVGYYTLLFASIVGEKGKVFSFEPQEYLFSLIQQSIKENGYKDKIIAENHCVGDIAGEAKIAQHQGPGDYGCTHLLSTPSASPYFDDMTVESTNILSLGDYHFLSSIDFVKIDIEGAEYLALKPFKDRLKQDQPIILSEVSKPLLAHVSGVSSADYIKLLKDCGYECYVFTDELTESIDDISTECQNVVFLPKGINLCHGLKFN